MRTNTLSVPLMALLLLPACAENDKADSSSSPALTADSAPTVPASSDAASVPGSSSAPPGVPGAPTPAPTPPAPGVPLTPGANPIPPAGTPADPAVTPTPGMDLVPDPDIPDPDDGAGAAGNTPAPEPEGGAGAIPPETPDGAAAAPAVDPIDGSGGMAPDVIEPDPVPPADGLCPYAGEAAADGQNWVNGEMLEFNDNGGWCWYQDERVLVDPESGELIIATVASGGSRDAAVEITHWDIAGKTGERHHLAKMGYADDHDVAALVKRPEGGYAAMWAGHNDDCNSYYSVYDGGSWSNASSFAWPDCPTSSGKRITYANMWYLGDTIYSYVRSIDTSPHYLFSENGGQSWTLAGRLTSTPQVGYVAGYYKYWGNNTDRIDFFGTEAHPRDNDNSLYHGYIQDGSIHNSTGDVIDDNFEDRSAQDVPSYSTVFATGTTINGVRLEHMWNADLVRYDDGTVAAIGTGRVSGTGSDDPDKRLLFHRFDGSEWTTTYLAKAGTKLYGTEQDYTGLGALDPDDPRVIYISTSYDPRTDEGQNNGKKEIWKGVTCDDGATFEWEPVTANSQMDNLRPVVPKWDAANRAVLWLRGSYTSAQSYNFKVVGLIEQN